MSSNQKRWSVELDGETDARFATRREAREHAAWLRRHPATQARKRHGNGGHVEIVDAWEL
jgi:hypothetical protein